MCWLADCGPSSLSAQDCNALANEVSAAHATATKILNTKLMDAEVRLQESLVSLKKVESDLTHEEGKTAKVKGELSVEVRVRL